MNKFLLSMSRMFLAITKETLVDVSEQIREILRNIVSPILIVLGSMGVMYMVVMGVQYAKAEGDEKRGTIKKRLVNTAIGVVAILTLTAFCFFIKWEEVVPSLFGYMGETE